MMMYNKTTKKKYLLVCFCLLAYTASERKNTRDISSLSKDIWEKYTNTNKKGGDYYGKEESC